MIPTTFPRLRRWWRRRHIPEQGIWGRWTEASSELVEDPVALDYTVKVLTRQLLDECEWLGLRPISDPKSRVSKDGSDFYYRNTAAVLVDVRYVKT